MSDKDLEELRKETETSDRISEEADQGNFGARVQTQLDAVDAGDKSHTVSAYDTDLAAVLHALDEDGDALEEDVAALQEELGKRVDADGAKRSNLVGLALRYALQSVDSERYEEATQAVEEWHDSGL